MLTRLKKPTPYPTELGRVSDSRRHYHFLRKKLLPLLLETWVGSWTAT